MRKDFSNYYLLHQHTQISSSYDRRRLHITPASFRALMSTYHVPVSLMAALSRPYMVCGTGFRKLSDGVSDHWCHLPVRVVVKCLVDAKEHTKSTAGSNQMDPFHYIHISGAKADIRGSHIGLYVRRDLKAKRMSVIVVNLLDGRFKDLIEEPLVRMRATFEKHLQREIANETSAFSDGSKDMNKALHIMAAHLHRYKSELGRLGFILSDLLSHRLDMDGDDYASGDGDDVDGSSSSGVTESEKEKIRIEQLQSQLKAITDFSDEMERKVQNILTLADAKLSQKVALQSHELTISVNNDSIAMKTIAILTMLFLPGTSFAAILAMPFFDDNEYLGEPSKVWIWVVLTIASTVVAFWGFFHVMNRQERSMEEKRACSTGDGSTDRVDNGLALA
ncbi:hypothetical protein SAPIO_CDS3828 [Scedosporium apiospermum]|uniref:Uncharacterized protein n=1 Tax=Pseudallescheria apiosperma TaxID=563466 RepID=A0A084G9R5_PSEDA|nr:uncharacterized protein SAPIO_CDS3828 [Scedosporium apiospermum]KEZ44077.1 hypothetical protein SAPIO_CDS3828 [Scedosporium apiospermum]